jgi:hypothetical protein
MDREKWFPIMERFKEIYGAQTFIEEAPNPVLANDEATIEEDNPNSDSNQVLAYTSIMECI